MKKNKMVLIATLVAGIMVTLVGCNNQNNATPGTQNQAGANNVQSSNTTEISEEEAKTIALEHAQVAEADTTALRVNKELDDGVSTYNVEFYVDNKEYDYELKASDGEILSTDYEIEDDFTNDQKVETAVSEADAKAAALAKVPGATDTDIRINLDKDDGKTVYEGKIVYEQKEYDFEIDAQTGDMLSWEEESIND